MNADSSFTLTRLLAWLDSDPDQAGRTYVRFQEELVAYLERRGASHAVAEEVADEALERVDKRLATSLLNEHYNSTEIRDVPGLCRLLHERGAENVPSPGRRIWQLLSHDGRALVTAIAREGAFESKQRSSLSRSLNEALRRRNLYTAEDFALALSRAGPVGGPLLDKIEADLARGLARLSQDEVERFNRRLLEAACPGMVKTSLGDTPDKEKLARCKHFSLLVMLERPRDPDVLGRGPAVPPYGLEEEEKRRQRSACLEECMRKLSPRDRVVLEKYYTGVRILSPEDEPLAGDELTEVRRRLAAEWGVAPETIRTIVNRGRRAALSCIERCMRRHEKR
ncbi:MAG TPA: hypothetical protein VF591_22565 [Pyrinomonadaceae bacterium]|jgi:hypothetical protein